MSGDFSLSRNARFYRATSVTDEDIRAILNAASEGAVRTIPNGDLFRAHQPRLNFKCSTQLFVVKRDVYFHTDPALKDEQHGFIAIIEIDEHLVVLKKNCSDLSEVLDEKYEKLGYESLSASVDLDEAEFKKINVRNMTVSERAIRSRSYEAWDLRGVISLHSAGRSIPSYLRVQTDTSLKSVTLASGRLVESSERQSLEGIALWARRELELMSSGSGDGGFLKNFARIVDLVEVERTAAPTSILIEVSLLQERVASGSIRVLFQTRSGAEIELRKRALEALWSSLSRVFEFDIDGNVIGLENEAHLKGAPGRKTLTFHSKTLSRIKIEGATAGKITLQKHLIKDGVYTICFDDPQYMYFARRCFMDVAGKSEIDSLMSLFEPKSELSLVTSEKGSYTASATSFDAGSVFHSVETIHAGDDFIFCDDLGNEWADHISFKKSPASVYFIHSKHKKVSNSASALHEIVGQAIKNLGNMHFSANQMLQKYQKWQGKVIHGTKINRVRRRNGQFPAYLKSTMGAYDFNRTCVLACSFVSHRAISRELSKIKAGTRVSGNVTQFYWIVSSFAHACRDAGVTPRIYCAP